MQQDEFFKVLKALLLDRLAWYAINIFEIGRLFYQSSQIEVWADGIKGRAGSLGWHVDFLNSFKFLRTETDRVSEKISELVRGAAGGGSSLNALTCWLVLVEVPRAPWA